jgi:pimeloyl-ACP methyl ester carboxylesterase
MVLAMNKTRIFLIIGLTKESAHWDDVFIEKLKEFYDVEDITAIDLPGTGAFIDQKSPATISEIVSVSRKNYESLFIKDENRLLVAISLGGMVATEWTRQFPQDFNQFVIMNSSFKGLNPLFKRLQPWGMTQFLKVFLAPTHTSKEKFILELVSNQKEVQKNTLSKWVEISKERPISKENMVRQTVAAARYTFNHKPEIPTFIIASTHDRLAHFSCSQALHKEWGGDFHLIEDPKAGHGLHVDIPEMLARLITDWSIQKTQQD